MRKPKVVTPVEDELDDLIDAAAAKAAPGALMPPPPDLADLASVLRPASDLIRSTVSHIELIPVSRSTPEQRTALVNLRDVLDRTRADLSTWVDAIDISFRRAAAEAGATEIVLADGVVKVDPPRGEWVVNVPMLKSELKELAAHGLLSQEELDSIFTTKVEETANNARLNYFASKRGDELADAINRARVWKDGNPANAKVRIQRRASDAD